MHSAYIENIATGTCILNPEESFQCVKVLRLRKGDSILVFDGNQYKANAEIIEVDTKQTKVLVKEINPIELKDVHLHIGIAPTKNADRFEWMLEKCVEIGIDTITPLQCEHSERYQLKMDRLHRLCIAAMKQSGNYKMPSIREPMKYATWIEEREEECRLIAHCENEEKQTMYNSIQNHKNIVISIGPEGDFSKAEIRSSIEQGFTPVTLGNSRLRTETAGVYACAVINSIFSSR